MSVCGKDWKREKELFPRTQKKKRIHQDVRRSNYAYNPLIGPFWFP